MYLMQFSHIITDVGTDISPVCWCIPRFVPFNPIVEVVNYCVFGRPVLLYRYLIDLLPTRWVTVFIVWVNYSFNTLLRSAALLPPHMRPSANSQPLPSPNNNSQTFTYDLPKSEPDSNEQPWDPNYSYKTPEGTGVQMKLPAETRSMTAQTTGEGFFFSYIVSSRLQHLSKKNSFT